MRAISLAVPFIAAGLMFAQTAPPKQAAPAPKNGPAAMNHHERNWMMRRLTARLNLTPDQQTKAHTIFLKAREEIHALQPQLHVERDAMLSAVKSDSAPQIDKLARQNAELNAKVLAIHTRSIAEFRAVLTPAQKSQFDRRLDWMVRPAPMSAGQHRIEGKTPTQG